MQIGTLLCWHK